MSYYYFFCEVKVVESILCTKDLDWGRLILIAGSFYEVSFIIYVTCCVHNEGMSSSFPCGCLVFSSRVRVGREQNDKRLSLKTCLYVLKEFFWRPKIRNWNYVWVIWVTFL